MCIPFVPLSASRLSNTLTSNGFEVAGLPGAVPMPFVPFPSISLSRTTMRLNAPPARRPTARR